MEEKLVRLSDMEYYLRQTAKNMLDEAEKEAESLADDERGRIAACVLALRTLADNAYRLPVVDAAPVVHARWLPRGSDDYDAGMYYCSACKDERYFGDEVITSEEASKYALYCPNCGAKMDAKEVPEDGNA